MSLDRIQVVRNFSAQFVHLQVLDAAPTTPYEDAGIPERAKMDELQRVGRLRLVLPAGAAVTVDDPQGIKYVVTNPANFPSLVHEIPIINGHRIVKFSGTGTLQIIIFAD
jgi:hypothetical protein